jgi:hypothetical protein
MASRTNCVSLDGLGGAVMTKVEDQLNFGEAIGLVYTSPQPCYTTLPCLLLPDHKGLRLLQNFTWEHCPATLANPNCVCNELERAQLRLCSP